MEKETKHDEVDALFEEVEEECVEKPYNYGDHVMEELEKEYLRPRAEMNEREKEKQELNTKLGVLKKKLYQSRNIKHAKPSVNQPRAALRKKIRAEMEIVKDRLYQIEIEEKGSSISSKSLVDNTIDQNLRHAQ